MNMITHCKHYKETFASELFYLNVVRSIILFSTLMAQVFSSRWWQKCTCHHYFLLCWVNWLLERAGSGDNAVCVNAMCLVNWAKTMSTTARISPEYVTSRRLSLKMCTCNPVIKLVWVASRWNEKIENLIVFVIHTTGRLESLLRRKRLRNVQKC